MDYPQDRLENVTLHQSDKSEKTLIELGRILFLSVRDASTLSEVELLIDIVGEYSTMVSFYGEKTERIPESLGVNLNEAALLKRDAYIHKNSSNEWKSYLHGFGEQLEELCSLDLKKSSY